MPKQRMDAACEVKPMNQHGGIALFLALTVSACSHTRVISEADVLEYASMPYDKLAYGSPRQVLGILDDTNVVVDFICSDLCPANTVRIVHLDLEGSASCDAVRGVERDVLVPVAIAARWQTFCFPRVLADNWNAYVR